MNTITITRSVSDKGTFTHGGEFISLGEGMRMYTVMRKDEIFAIVLAEKQGYNRVVDPEGFTMEIRAWENSFLWEAMDLVCMSDEDKIQFLVDMITSHRGTEIN